MSAKRDRDLGTVLIAAAVLVTALSNWDTITAHIPGPLKPYAESPVMAVVLALAGIYFLWRSANSAAQLEGHIAVITRSVDEAQNSLRRRIEQAEAKLVKAIDDQNFNWGPAHERLQREAEQRARQTVDGWMNELRQVYMSFRRRAERGYLDGDDLSRPPPEG